MPKRNRSAGSRYANARIFTLQLSEEDLMGLEEISDQLGITRSEVTRALIRLGKLMLKKQKKLSRELARIGGTASIDVDTVLRGV